MKSCISGYAFWIQLADLFTLSIGNLGPKSMEECVWVNKTYCCDQRNWRACWSRLGPFFDHITCCTQVAASPNVHFISFGHINTFTKALAHSVEFLAKRRLQVFGLLYDKEPLMFEPPHPGTYNGRPWIKKMELTLHEISKFPDDDFVMYLDSTDTLLQYWPGNWYDVYWNLTAQHRAQHQGQEPVVWAQLMLCYPFEKWAREASMNAVRKDQHRSGHVYGSMGDSIKSSDVCDKYRASYGPGYVDSGAWFGRVRVAKELFQLILVFALKELETQDIATLLVLRLWFPWLIQVDTQSMLIWSTDMGSGQDISAAEALRNATERRLCDSNYFDVHGRPALLATTGSRPFALHYVGPGKQFLGRLCARRFVERHGTMSAMANIYDLDGSRASSQHGYKAVRFCGVFPSTAAVYQVSHSSQINSIECQLVVVPNKRYPTSQV